jgi:hypothetical protein
LTFLYWLQDSRLAIWVAESDRFYGYSGILTLHTLGLALVVGASAVLDLRVLGVAPAVPLSALRGIGRPMWIGFALNAATGAVLFAAAAVLKGTQWIFYLKLGLIASALVVDGRLRRRAFGDAVVPLRAFAVASLVLWTGAIVAGRLMAYVE